MSRLDRCVCGGPHSWRCAAAILHDRAVQILAKRVWTTSVLLWARAINAYQQVKLENRALRAEIQKLKEG